MSLRIAVLMGGRSSEHEVSLASAGAVIDALAAVGHEPVPVVIDRAGGWTLDSEPVALAGHPELGPALIGLSDGGARAIDLVFPVLHGPFGEDGTIQGACETAGVAYVGAGVAASAIAMDKVLFKRMLLQAGLPTAEHVAIRASDWASDPGPARAAVAADLGYPCFCKPASLGSSVGISRVGAPDELDAAVEVAFSHCPTALVERAIAGREIEVGVLGDRDLVVSPPGEITYAGEWYDYATKYEPGRMSLRVPAVLDPAVAERARELAAAAYRLIDCQGMARIDFFAEADGTVLISELNTIPGFTPTSVYAALMAAAGVDYARLIGELVDLAGGRAAQMAGYRH